MIFLKQMEPSNRFFFNFYCKYTIRLYAWLEKPAENAIVLVPRVYGCVCMSIRSYLFILVISLCF